MAHRLIDDDVALAELAAELSARSWVGLDTEFERVRTYYPRLCLLQLATEDGVACVDPLGCDVGALGELLFAADTVKVLHSGRQDLEVLWRHCGRVVRPVFDTQIAASLCGLGEQIGYAALVAELDGARLGKAHTRTAWCRRPLSAAELEYAEEDVRYLGALYRGLHERLAAAHRLDWAEEENAALATPALYGDDPEQAYRRLGRGQALAGDAQQVLRELCTWRERAAQEHDLPREWVVGDAELVAVAVAAPASRGELARVAGVGERRRRRWGEAMLAAVARARAQPAAAVWPRARRLGRAENALCDELMALVRRRAAQHGVSAAVLAPRADLRRLVLGERDLPVLSGWRRGVVGEELLKRAAAAAGGHGDA